MGDAAYAEINDLLISVALILACISYKRSHEINYRKSLIIVVCKLNSTTIK